MKSFVSLSGGHDLDRALRELARAADARTVGRAALRAAARPIVADAKARAPDDPATGANKFLRQSIKQGPISRARAGRGQSLPGKGSNRAKDEIWIAVGIDQSVDPPRRKPRRTGKGSYRDPGVAGVSVMIEFGTSKAAAQPFMRPAWDANRADSVGIIAGEITPQLEKAAQRIARRARKSG